MDCAEGIGWASGDGLVTSSLTVSDFIVLKDASLYRFPHCAIRVKRGGFVVLYGGYPVSVIPSLF